MAGRVYSVLMGFLAANLATVILVLLGNWCIVRKYHTRQVAENAQQFEAHETERLRLFAMMQEEFLHMCRGAPAVLGSRSDPSAGSATEPCGSLLAAPRFAQADKRSSDGPPAQLWSQTSAPAYRAPPQSVMGNCLLYTSDAADE